MAETYEIDITADLFKRASLLSVSLGCWSGERAQDKNDEEAQKANVDEKLYKRGQKILVDPKTLKPFSLWRSRIAKHMARNATRFYIPGVWLVSHDVLPQVKTWLVDTRAKIQEDIQTFLDNYDTNRTAQIALFNETYPEKAGTFDADYPTVDALADKFRLTWVTGNWQMSKLSEVAAEEAEEFRIRSRSYLEDLAGQLRITAAEACAEFLKGLSCKSGEVNDKKIQRFKEFTAKFAANNFMNDEELTRLMGNITASTVNISGWTSDEVTQSRIKEHLASIVELGKDEGAAAEVASAYVRRISFVEQPVERDQDEEPDQGVIRRIAAPQDPQDLDEADEFEAERIADEIDFAARMAAVPGPSPELESEELPPPTAHRSPLLTVQPEQLELIDLDPAPVAGAR